MEQSSRYDASYQGQPGAYSEGAALALCGEHARLLPCETLATAVAAVVEARASAAVIPLENTLAGAVPGALSQLLMSGLVVHDQVAWPIDHVLAAPPGAMLDHMVEVLSHPVALAQCTRFFRTRPNVRVVPVFDTAGAVEIVMRGGRLDQAAIASRRAAALHGAVVLAEHLQDDPANYTRFVRMGPGPVGMVAGPCRVLIAMRLAHHCGTLAGVLQALARASVNLTRIDSCPVTGSPFEYEFFLEGEADDAAVLATALTEVSRLSTQVRLLGRIPHTPLPTAVGAADGRSIQVW